MQVGLGEKDDWGQVVVCFGVGVWRVNMDVGGFWTCGGSDWGWNCSLWGMQCLFWFSSGGGNRESVSGVGKVGLMRIGFVSCAGSVILSWASWCCGRISSSVVSHSLSSLVGSCLSKKVWKQLVMHKSFHSFGGFSDSVCEITVENRSLKITWNWGEMWLVVGLSTSGTHDAYLSPNPRKTPWHDLGFQQGSFFPSCRVGLRT